MNTKSSTPSQAYKPVHGGYPSVLAQTDVELMEAAIAEEDGPSSPIPGSEWTSPATNTGSDLFDATRLSIALSQIAGESNAKAWKLTSAMRNVRIAETEVEKVAANANLRALYQIYMASADTDLTVRMLVNDLANTIDADVRPARKITNMATIYPSMDRYYAFRPVWDFIYAIRKAFKRTDA